MDTVEFPEETWIRFCYITPIQYTWFRINEAIACYRAPIVTMSGRQIGFSVMTSGPCAPQTWLKQFPGDSGEPFQSESLGRVRSYDPNEILTNVLSPSESTLAIAIKRSRQTSRTSDDGTIRPNGWQKSWWL